MRLKRKTFSPDFKAQVALEVLISRKPNREIASKYKLHPNQVSKWKQHLIRRASGLFIDGRRRKGISTQSDEIKRLSEENTLLRGDIEWLLEKMNLTADQKRRLIDDDNEHESITHQCRRLDLPRSTYYYQSCRCNDNELEIMNALDREYTLHPFYGKRRMARHLSEMGYHIGVKRSGKLMRILGMVSTSPQPRTPGSAVSGRVFPYLLTNLKVTRPDQVWVIDATFVPLCNGFVFLVAILDWFSRYVIAWDLSETLNNKFCICCAEEAFRKSGVPEIFNSDRGPLFANEEFIGVLERHSVRISMNGNGRAYDNIMVERLWRTVKYEEIYLKEYRSIDKCRESLTEYFQFYNMQRYHSGIGATPFEVYSRHTDR